MHYLGPRDSYQTFTTRYSPSDDALYNNDADCALMLADEYGTASNIKSRVNRLSVLGAITSVQHRLKLYTKVPPNGLVVYCGTIVTDEGKEKG